MASKPAQEPTPSLADGLRYFTRLTHLARPYWGELAKGIALGSVVGIFGMLVPYASKLLIDDAYPAGDFGLMHVIVIGVLVLTVASRAMGAVQGYYSQAVAGRLASATSLLFFNHIQHLPAAFFDEHRVGEVMSRFQDTRGALAFQSKAFQTIVTSGIYILLVPPFLLLLNWRLALLSIIVVPATVLTSAATSRVVRRYYRLNAEVNAELRAYQYEVLSQVRSLKSMALEGSTYAQAELQVRDALQAQLRARGVGAIVGLTNGLLQAIGAGVFTWYAWTLILQHQLTLGTFIAFTAYVGYLTRPLTSVTSLFNEFQQAAVSLGRMFEYIDTPTEQEPELAYVAGSPIRHRISGEIEFRRVSFSYGADREILHDVSLVIPRGQITAIVGPSGAGKSSLIRLIPRMAHPTGGQILIDGVSVLDISLPDLRRQVATVWQDTGLMRGTIWQNLTIGLADVPRHVVEDAVRACRLEDMIAALPDGYDTSVAEWGATLSGGQRQRMAIARALVRDAPILLLDEATANIDVRTEEEILESVFARYREKTIVFVTHRVATAALADQVCVIEDGSLQVMGAPHEVAAANERYELLAPGDGDRSRRLRVVTGQ
jgi:ABC-type bacteriocin/lantibiotic exporter with double-glycine peptidase domain